MRRPDAFIVGAPKCGTTSLHEYLAGHPEIFMAARKEIHFFGSDLRYDTRRCTEKDYLACFARAHGYKRVGESSVYYLVSKAAAAEIKVFCPHAKIIIMLRSPAEMMYSLHSQAVYGGREDIADFTSALAAEDARDCGEGLGHGIHFIEGLLYRRVAGYTDQVGRYFDQFGRDNVHVIIFDDFKADTARTYHRVLEFLDVDPTATVDFKIANPNKRVRSRLLQRLVYKNRLARSYRLQRLVPAPLRNALRRLNTRYEPRRPMDEELRRQLSAEFAPEVRRLSELLGRDLTHWCRTLAAGPTA